MPTPARNGRRARSAALVVLFAALQLPGIAVARAEQPGIGVVADDTVDGRSRLVVDVAGAPAPGSFSVTVDGRPQPVTATPLLSDRLAMVTVVDASSEGGPTLQAALN